MQQVDTEGSVVPQKPSVAALENPVPLSERMVSALKEQAGLKDGQGVPVVHMTKPKKQKSPKRRRTKRQ